MRIRTDDEVKIIAGADKGKTGKVIRVLADADKVVVQGINLVYKHVRPSAKNQKGGRVSKEMPIHVSNVMLISAAAGRPTRTGVRFLANGQKERYCKKSGASLGAIGAAKPAFAKLAAAQSRTTAPVSSGS